MNRSEKRRHPVAVALGLLALAWSAAACRAGAPSEPVRAEVGGLRLAARLEPAAPRQEGNALRLTVEDVGGKPVTGARVSARTSMPAMGSMPAMSGGAEIADEGNGRYTARFDLPTAGSWTLDLDVAAGDMGGSVSFSLTVGRAGLVLVGSDEAIEGAAGHADHAPGGEIAYWTCSMHPSVRQSGPGTCPICSMDLVPVTRAEAQTGEITIDAARRQELGVETATVGRQRLAREIRAVGRVVYDETRLTDVTVRVQGYVGRLFADATGQRVVKGAPLLTLYSPDLYAAQEEYLTALASQRAAQSTAAPERADYLVAASRQRLRLWNLGDAEVAELERTGKVVEYLTISAPASGFVVEKNVVEGAAVEPGMKLYRLAALDPVWVEAEVYETDLPLAKVGQSAQVTLPYLPDRRFAGRVAFVYPYLDSATRTGRVRIELANPDLDLKPEMYADVKLEVALGERLVVPEEAVLYAGERRFVFVDLGEGKLKPREVQIGIRSGDWLEVLEGVEAGDEIVRSGNFLVAAESRLKQALEQWQ